MEQTKQDGQSFGAGPSKNYTSGKGKQVSGDGAEPAPQQQACSEEDSEDDSLLIGDLIAPGSDQLRFGSLDTVELRKVVINEYGSNFMTYKQDPLVSIQAKKALFESKKDDVFQIDDIIEKSGSSKKLPTILEDKGEEVMDRAVSISPVKGSQGGPEVEISSQEELQQNARQDIDWDLIQKEDEQEARVDEVVMDSVNDNDNTKTSPQENNDVQAVHSEDSSQLEVIIEENQTKGICEPSEQSNAWENQSNKVQDVEDKGQDEDKDGWSKWQDMRQSKRIRASNNYQMKMGEQAPSKILQNMEDEGDGYMKTCNVSIEDYMTWCFGLLKEGMKEQVVQAAEVVKSSALYFHKQDMKTHSQGNQQLVPFAG